MFRALLCSSSGCQNCIIEHLLSSHSAGGRPVHEHYCAHHQDVRNVLYSIWYHHTLQVAVRFTGVHRTVTCRVWWYQMLYYTILTSWWWAQKFSKHVEEYNKLIIKQEFVHYVGQLLRLYWDARSAKHKEKRTIHLFSWSGHLRCWCSKFLTALLRRNWMSALEIWYRSLQA